MKPIRIAALVPLLVTACAETPQTLVAPDEAAHFASVPNWSSWSAATALSEINTPAATEGCPFIAQPGSALAFAMNRGGGSGGVLLFASNRAGGSGALDLYVSRWDPKARTWGAPTSLGPGINTAANEQCPVLLNNGKELIFISDRPGGAGGLDIWLARRQNDRDGSGWQAPVNLTALNTSAAEFGPGAYEDRGRTVLVFNSNRPGGAGLHDLYTSTQSRDGTFAAPAAAAGLNTASEEQFAALSRDGREIFFSSDRAGGQGGLDLWQATRERTSDAWSPPVNLGPTVNSPSAEGRSSISWDGRTLFFHSNRTGSVDLYSTTRTPARGSKK